MDDLVRNARPGDRFFFHCEPIYSVIFCGQNRELTLCALVAGHAGQDKTDDPGEEDGMDECEYI
jgi:hypothetical protein